MTQPQKPRCPCARCRIRSLVWPVLLIALGAIFLVGEFTRFDFGNLWPVLLIVAGGMMLAQAVASRDGHIGS